MSRFISVSSLLFLILCAFLSIFLILPAKANAKIYINIYQAQIKKIRVAVPDIKNLTKYNQHSSIAGKFARIIRHDLSVIGYFHIVNPVSYLEDPQTAPIKVSKVNFSDWSLLNTQYLINGEYKIKNGKIKIKANLISVYSQRLLLTETLKGGISSYRYLANKLADNVLQFLTGVKGPFTTKVFFVGEKNGVKNIFAMDFGGHRVKKITDNSSINIFPYPSPDGKKVAYISFKDGNPAVFIKDLKTGNTVKLNLPGPADYVAWSPTGKKLALSLTPNRYSTEIYTANPNGTGLIRLTDTDGINISPSFSPNGNRIAFVSNISGGPQIYIMNSDGSDQHRITFNGSYYNTNPAWSPNGKKIVFTSFINGTLQVCVINPDGSSERLLTDTPYSAQDPSWTRGSKIISFNTEIAGRQELYLIDLNESGMMRLMPHLFPEMRNYSNPVWTLKSVY